MKKIYLTGAAILALFSVGCSNDDDGGGGGQGNCESDIAFFQDGKFQKYSLTQFGSDGGTMRMSYDCDGDGFLTTMEFRNAAGAVTQTLENKMWQDGVWLTHDIDNDGDHFRKIYKKDAQLGDTWTETAEDGATVIHEVTDMDSLISVPAGDFHCKVYHYQKSDVFNDSYIFWNDEYGQIMEDAGFFQIKLIEHN